MQRRLPGRNICHRTAVTWKCAHRHTRTAKLTAEYIRHLDKYEVLAGIRDGKAAVAP